MKGLKHCVAVYRCKDGRYVYYNSNPSHPVFKGFKTFLRRNKIRKRDVIYVDHGSDQYNETCAYMSMTFLDIVTSFRLPSSLVSHFYQRHMKYYSERIAVERVRTMLTEFENSIELPTGNFVKIDLREEILLPPYLQDHNYTYKYKQQRRNAK